MTMTIDITWLNVRELNLKSLSLTSTLHPENKGPNRHIFTITGPCLTRSKIGMHFLIIYIKYYHSYLTFIEQLCCIIFNIFGLFIICQCSKSSYCLHPVSFAAPNPFTRMIGNCLRCLGRSDRGRHNCTFWRELTEASLGYPWQQSIKAMPRIGIPFLYIAHLVITVTSWWARLRLESPASPLFTQPVIRVQIKENIKAPRQWPLCGKFTGDRWIPCTNGQQRGKCTHFMTSSWLQNCLRSIRKLLRIISFVKSEMSRTRSRKRHLYSAKSSQCKFHAYCIILNDTISEFLSYIFFSY